MSYRTGLEVRDAALKHSIESLKHKEMYEATTGIILERAAKFEAYLLEAIVPKRAATDEA